MRTEEKAILCPFGEIRWCRILIGDLKVNMLIEKVLTYPTRILNETERSYYFANGCVRIERLISNHWLERIKTASANLIDQSREVTENNNMFLLETGHSAQTPRLKRLISPVSHHPDFWSFASNSEIVDAVSDVVGPDVRSVSYTHLTLPTSDLV